MWQVLQSLNQSII
jgi:phosphatidylinositol-3-phosphatase